MSRVELDLIECLRVFLTREIEDTRPRTSHPIHTPHGRRLARAFREAHPSLTENIDGYNGVIA